MAKEQLMLTRFCSFKELEALRQGKTIFNTTDHYRDGRGGSLSRGFCLTEDPPEEAWRYLKGIVTPEACMRLEIERDKLTASSGKYAGEVEYLPDGRFVVHSKLRTEWCTTILRPKWLKEVVPLESFVPDYEIEAARKFMKIKEGDSLNTIQK